VLLNDRVAEHVPGCNMAFRRDALEAVGGFNPVYLRAGDDVDICWRLQARGHEIGFAPSALVWHHHRSTVRAYWRQQVGYGEGEAWLDAHHPEKFVRGQMLWKGHIYSPLPFLKALSGRRVNTGVWGTAAFPSIYSESTYRLEYLPHSPAWMLASTALVVAGVFDLVIATPDVRLLVLGVAGWVITLARCVEFALASDLSGLPVVRAWPVWRSRLAYRVLIGWMHLINPIARMWGRIKGMASMPQATAPEHITRRPWTAPWPRTADVLRTVRLGLGRTDVRGFWSETWVDHARLLTEMVGVVRAARPAPVVEVDEGWRPDRDFSIAVGRWGWLHVQALVEEHAKGKCLTRVRARLRVTFIGSLQAMTTAAVLTGATLAMMSMRVDVGSALGGLAVLVVAARSAWQAVRTVAVFDRALARVVTDAGMIPLPQSPSGVSPSAAAPVAPGAAEGVTAAPGR
jgi:hypothetical protein